MDSSAISAVRVEVLKLTFSRACPDQRGDPDEWFQGRGHEGFPSGEVALPASFGTPLIVSYARSDPWIRSLELLPLYDAIARMKSQAHWQNDVIAGWALGPGIGYGATTFETPDMVGVLPRGFSAGISKCF